MQCRAAHLRHLQWTLAAQQAHHTCAFVAATSGCFRAMKLAASHLRSGSWEGWGGGGRRGVRWGGGWGQGAGRWVGSRRELWECTHRPAYALFVLEVLYTGKDLFHQRPESEPNSC